MIPVALAILERDGRFLMQLRDDLPHILYPGVWGLFGGHLEAGEEPEAGLIREVAEEIGYRVPGLKKFRCYDDEIIARTIYHVPLTVTIDLLHQTEGQDLDLITPDDIHKGFAYSKKLGEYRALGDIHRRILVDFIASR